MNRLATIADRLVAGVFLEPWLKEVFRDLELILTDGEGADKIVSRTYMTFEHGTSSKYHAFMVCAYTDSEGETLYVGGNAYGRIGKRAKAMAVARSESRSAVESTVAKKERQKRAKGYEVEFSE